MHGASTRGVDPRSSRSFLSVVVLTRRCGPRHHASTQFALAKPVRPLPTLCPCASLYGRDRAAPRSRPDVPRSLSPCPFFAAQLHARERDPLRDGGRDDRSPSPRSALCAAEPRRAPPPADRNRGWGRRRSRDAASQPRVRARGAGPRDGRVAGRRRTARARACAARRDPSGPQPQADVPPG